MSVDYIISKVVEDLYLIRVLDSKTTYFEGLWYIPEGVVYNSYVLTTSSGAVVFDTAKPSFRETYLEGLKSIVDLRDITYIVTHHMEPDHSGLIKDLSELTRARVLGHPLAGKMLRSFYGFSGDFTPVVDGQEISVGEYKIRFIHTPWLHWPETIMSYIEKYSALLTCDAFGAYGSYTKVFYDELSEAERALHMKFMLKYFANIIGFYRQWVIKNLEKIFTTGVKVKYILPSHGVSFRGSDVENIIKTYVKWGTGEPVAGKVTLVYTSMYGFVESIARRVVRELEKSGLSIALHYFNDTEHGHLSEIIADAYDSEVLVFATSAYDADAFPLIKQVVELVSKKSAIDKKKIVVAALYGWGPRAGAVLREILGKAGVENPIVLEHSVGDADKLVEEVVKAVKG